MFQIMLHWRRYKLTELHTQIIPHSTSAFQITVHGLKYPIHHLWMTQLYFL